MADEKNEKESGDGGRSAAALQSEFMQSMRYYGTLTASMALLGLFFMVVQNEIAWSANTTMGLSSRFCPDARDMTCDPRDAIRMFPVTSELLTLNIVRAVGISLTTALALLFHYSYFSAWLKYMKTRNQVPANCTLVSSPLFLRYAAEFIALSIHVFPGIDALSASPVLYLCLSQLMFVRWLFLLRVTVHHSSLNSSNGRFISALTNVEFSTSFILKTAMKDKPAVFLSTVLAVLLFSSAYAVRNIESLVCAYDRSLGCMPLSFEDSIWLCVITMMTVGYGDITAKTPGGRLAILVGGIGGTFVLASTVAVLADGLQLSRSEAKVITFLRKHDFKQRVTNAAALVIQTAYRLHKLKHGGFAHDAEDLVRQRLAKEAAAARKELRSGKRATASIWCCRNANRSSNVPKKHADVGKTEATHTSSTVVPVTGLETPAKGESDRKLFSDRHSNTANKDAASLISSANAVPTSVISPASSVVYAGPPATRRGWGCCRPKPVAPNEPFSAGAALAAQPLASTHTNAHVVNEADVAMFQRLLFVRIEAFRSVKRYVLSHDPTDPMDRQLTLLETLEVHVDEIRSNVEILSEFLLGAGSALAGGKATTEAETFSTVLTPVAQAHLAEIAAKKTGRAATTASRALAAALKASKRDGIPATQSLKSSTSPGFESDSMAAKSGGLAPDAADSYIEQLMVPTGLAADATDGGEANEATLSRTVALLASQLAATVAAMSKMQHEFSEYKAVTEARMAELEHANNVLHVHTRPPLTQLSRDGGSPSTPSNRVPSPADGASTGLNGDVSSKSNGMRKDRLPVLAARAEVAQMLSPSHAHSTAMLNAVLDGDEDLIRNK